MYRKQKNSLEGFAAWYPKWQANVVEDRVMTWIVNFRNRVVKEGDLELASSVIVRYQSPNYKRKVIETPSLPQMTTDEIVVSLLEAGIPAIGLLTVRRVWRDSALPGYELMGALATAWRHCARLVVQAHGGTEIRIAFRTLIGTESACRRHYWRRITPACSALANTSRSS